MAVAQDADETASYACMIDGTGLRPNLGPTGSRCEMDRGLRNALLPKTLAAIGGSFKTKAARDFGDQSDCKKTEVH